MGHWLGLGAAGITSDNDVVAATVCVQFDAAGTYDFVCGIHASMTGTVTVE